MGFMEKTIGENRVYTGKIIKVRVDEVQLDDGRVTVREVCEHPGGVAVLPLLPNGDVILVRQYRYPYRTELLEIPAGKLESGEAHLACGIRELEEETGYQAGKMKYLGCMYPSAGYLNEKLHIYLATELTAGEAHPDEGEHLAVETMPFDTLLEMIMEDKIRDAKTTVAVLKTKILLDSEK